MLVRLARQAELGPGQSLEKESNGRRLLIVRHPTNGSVSVMDAHCFHMGTPLVGGDIEDLDGRCAVVCPAHRYRIDIATGQKLDTDLCNKLCASGDQKQRIYTVACDNDYIWADIPHPVTSLPPLPSDYYNQVQQEQQPELPEAPPAARNYGLFGAAPSSGTLGQPQVATPLQPYADFNAWPVMPNTHISSTGTASGAMDTNQNGSSAEEPPLVLSQEAPSEQTASQPMPTSPFTAASPSPGGASGRIGFPAVKRDPPHVARRKAATAAIMAKSYRPPMANDSAMQSPVKAPEPVAATPVPAVQPGVVRQRTLLESWGMQQPQQQAVTAGPDSMDMT